jgi:YaiO family outer membrane protein
MWRTYVQRHLGFILFAACVVLSQAPPVAAQTGDVLASARSAIADGRRPDALAVLRAHLSGEPRDVDARFLYGAILSWEGRYDEARRELQQVLTQTPDYDDARVALMNVEWWSGRTEAARDAADAILARDPGNSPARVLRERLDAATRPWSASVSYSQDRFNGGRLPWHEYAVSLSRLTPRGSLIVRTSEARRFGLDGRLVEAEFYPRLRTGTYAFVGIGGAPGPSLYPSHRVAFDLYQSVGGGVEVSGGLRRLAFATPTMIYVGTVSKYVGSWMLTGRVFHVPGEGDLDSTSVHGGFRRYIRGDGTSHIGVALSRGSSREEIRNVSDLTTLNSGSVRVDVDQQLARRMRVFATVGTSRQERQSGTPVWQTSMSSGFTVAF